ncbi:MAG: GNAT family N-acetyltransferase [Pseudomonadota bacterium]
MATETSDVILRAPNAEDFEEWSSLWAAYLAFYGTKRDTAIHRTLFARLLSNDPRDFRGFVAEVRGALAGLVHYVFHPHAWRVEETCYLQDLYVDPAARGTGLGRKLIEAVYGAADAADCPSVYWLTQEFNLEARRLYDRVAHVTPFIRYQRAI